MKPKYSIGKIVRIKETGEKVKIVEISTWDNETNYYVKNECWYGESELAPYRPSRTGKYRNAKGQFISKAAQEQREQFGFEESKQTNYKKLNMDEIHTLVEILKKNEQSLEYIKKKLDRLSEVTEYKNI